MENPFATAPGHSSPTTINLKPTYNRLTFVMLRRHRVSGLPTFNLKPHHQTALMSTTPHMLTNRISSHSPVATPPRSRWPLTHIIIILGLWLILYVAAAFTPPLLDDADATHAQAAQAMLATGDWVTLHVDGIRYLEKPPLPYWITALSLRLLAPHPQSYALSQYTEDTAALAVHFPLALTILGLTLLSYAWTRRAFPSTDQHAPLYAALFILTSAGVFLFTRVFIPDALLSLLLAFALYALLRSLQHPEAPPTQPSSSAQGFYPYALWAALALAVLTKGLVAIVFVFATALIFLFWTGQLHLWRRLRPVTGLILFLAIAAPWHILAGLRNTGGANGHGFFWFYFINEHVLRFLGRRIPRDYNKLPGYLYWSLHLVWLFPWSLFAPAAVILAWRNRKPLLTRSAPTFRHQTIRILLLFSALVLVFFSLSTNQEYYTFPAYLPLLVLIAAALTHAESSYDQDRTARRWISVAHAALTVVGLAVAITLFLGLWTSRHLPFVPDIGDLLAHRGVGDYTLSMSHLFDLTGPSFAALRLPATLAALAFAFGPAIAWFLRSKRHHLAATSAIALTSTVFLIAAHIALIRFGPMLSSQTIAAKIQQLQSSGAIAQNTPIYLYGDQSYGSSIPFYLNQQVNLVEGRSSSMLFGSTFPDAPPIFLTNSDLLKVWGTGNRKLLFVPLERRDLVDKLLGNHKILITETSGKALFTDRPLTP